MCVLCVRDGVTVHISALYVMQSLINALSLVGVHSSCSDNPRDPTQPYLGKKKGNLVAMTTPVVRQLVNNSSLACSCLIFVFLLHRLYKHCLKLTDYVTAFPEEVTLPLDLLAAPFSGFICIGAEIKTFHPNAFRKVFCYTVHQYLNLLRQKLK